MHILLATDADWIVDDVVASLGADDVTFTVCREGRVVADQVGDNTPDLAIFDLQIGSMGGMAVTMSLRLDESAGTLPHVPVLMLLDRRADVHLARRSGAEGWLIKPLDSLRLKRAANAVLGGGIYTEGIPVTVQDSVEPAVAESADEPSEESPNEVSAGDSSEESTEEESVDAG